MRRKEKVDEGRPVVTWRALAVVAAVFSFAAVALRSGVRPVRACMIPVFRYALENWPAEPYVAIVFRRGGGGPPPRDQDNLGALQAESSPTYVLAVDVSEEMTEPVRAIYEATQGQALPRLVVCCAGDMSVKGMVWSGGLDSAAVKSVLQSPARAEIARRIVKGDAVVWVLLESGEREKDEAAVKLLESELQKMEKALQMADDFFDEAEEPELRLSFSALRVSRDDPAEKMLVRMLLKSEPDLTTPERAKEPMVFPIFGRGRSLCGLVGKGINEGNIWEIGEFLIGPCSCEVKEASPGTQILISTDWDALVYVEETVEEALPLPGAFAEEEETPSTGPVAAAEAEPVGGWEGTVRNVVIVCVLGLAFVAAGTLVLKRLKR